MRLAALRDVSVLRMLPPAAHLGTGPVEGCMNRDVQLRAMYCICPIVTAEGLPRPTLHCAWVQVCGDSQA
jgi:hypothetical protein